MNCIVFIFLWTLRQTKMLQALYALAIQASHSKEYRAAWRSPSVYQETLLMSFHTHVMKKNTVPQNKSTNQSTCGNDFSLELRYSIDPLTSIMLVLITTVMVIIMPRDQGYLRFFAHMRFFFYFHSTCPKLFSLTNLI